MKKIKIQIGVALSLFLFLITACIKYDIGYFESNPGIEVTGDPLPYKLSISMRQAVADSFVIEAPRIPNIRVTEYRRSLSYALRQTFSETFESIMWINGFNDEGVSLVITKAEPNWIQKAETSQGIEVGAEISFQVLLYNNGSLVKDISKKVHSNLSASANAGAVQLLRDAVNIMCRYLHKEILEEMSQHGSGNGTGFLISNQGHIVTNSHVITGAKSIHIKGIKGDYSKEWPAELISEDTSNDLALLKVSGATFDSVPFKTRTKGLETGEDVFVLGYPMVNTMGEEIKVTKGIISSKTGFQGNQSTFQVSAAVQPGNSGSPLFDEKGQLIGVISSVHRNTENVTYAIKISQVQTLFDNLELELSTSKINKLQNLTLAEKVKLISDGVYIIIVEK